MTAKRHEAVAKRAMPNVSRRCEADIRSIDPNDRSGSAAPVGQISQQTLGRPRLLGRRQRQHWPNERSSGHRHRRCLADGSVYMTVNCGRDHLLPHSVHCRHRAEPSPERPAAASLNPARQDTLRSDLLRHSLPRCQKRTNSFPSTSSCPGCLMRHSSVWLAVITSFGGMSHLRKPAN